MSPLLSIAFLSRIPKYFAIDIENITSNGHQSLPTLPIKMPDYSTSYSPYQSRKHRYPKDPYSPASPFTCFIARVWRVFSKPSFLKLTSSNGLTSTPDPVPARPPPWIWYCHTCQSYYALEATNRCLREGHRLCVCANAIVNKRTGKNRRAKSCRSECDAWKKWRDQNCPYHRTLRVRDSDWFYSCKSSSNVFPLISLSSESGMFSRLSMVT